MADEPILQRVRATTDIFGIVKFAKPGESGPGLAISSEDPRIKAISGGPSKPFVLPKHAATHKRNGTDPIRLDELAVPADNTQLDATTALHGLMSKADKVKLDAVTLSGKIHITATTPVAGFGNNDDAALVLDDLSIRFKTGGTWILFGYVAKAVSDNAVTFKTPTAGDGEAALTTL